MGSLQAVAKEYTAAVYKGDMVTEDAGVFQRAGSEVTVFTYTFAMMRIACRIRGILRGNRANAHYWQLATPDTVLDRCLRLYSG